MGVSTEMYARTLLELCLKNWTTWDMDTDGCDLIMFPAQRASMQFLSTSVAPEIWLRDFGFLYVFTKLMKLEIKE